MKCVGGWMDVCVGGGWDSESWNHRVRVWVGGGVGSLGVRQSHTGKLCVGKVGRGMGGGGVASHGIRQGLR